eukprot:gb/GEZN01014645.1/.p1 GENE.gb/GEZN01014645.1/~~gb/GEZN01014645.1/.p1  ORF type:complete len:222 (-),score=4.12 gb/GEZN01014645.1/:247-912(-)
MGNKPTTELQIQESEDLINEEQSPEEDPSRAAPRVQSISWSSLKDTIGNKSFSRSTGSDQQSSSSGWSFFSQSDEDTSPWAKCGLSRTQRLYGFAACFLLGILCSFLSSLFVGMILVRPIKFAFPYTLGSILSMGSTSFLVGPARQLRTMFDPIRRWATLTYLTSLFATLYFAVVKHNGILTLAMLIIQFLSFVWYSASYIPYARTFILSCLSRTCGRVCK